MKNLIEKIASYERATQGLIDKIGEYEKYIRENVPGDLREKFGLAEFRGNQFSEEIVSINGKYVPEKVKQLGGGRYWYGDFNHWYDAVRGEELIEWAKGLPALLTEALEYVERQTEEANEILSRL